MGLICIDCFAMMLKLLPFLLFLSVPMSHGAEIMISGQYQGQNIYVQNPFGMDRKEYCTEEVFVNDKLVLSHPEVGAYEIDLSYLPLNTPITIKIVFKEGCKPYIVNPQVIGVDDFKFITIEVGEGEVRWITAKEPASGTYSIERFEGENWTEIAQVAAKGGKVNNFYKLPMSPASEGNIFRIKMTQPEGLTLYSREVSYQNP